MKAKMLIVGPDKTPLSYARVVKGLATHLKQHFDIVQVATDMEDRPDNAGWPIFPADRISELNNYLNHTYNTAVCDIDAIVFVFDACAISQLSIDLHKFFPKSKRIVYTPLDGINIKPDAFFDYKNFDHVVTFTKYAKSELQNLIKNHTGKLNEVGIVGHGVDTDYFVPQIKNTSAFKQELLNHRKKNKQRLLEKVSDRTFADDPFLVLNINQNIYRKRLDITIEAFAKALKGKNAYLIFTSNWQSWSGYNLLQLARDFGVYDQVLLSYHFDFPRYLEEEHLKLLYAASDVGINTSTGEGWGLPAFEHACTGAPQIVSGNSASKELWNKIGLTIECEAKAIFNPTHHVDHFVPYVDDAADKLETLFQDKIKRVEAGVRCFKHVQSNQFQWKSCANELSKFINRVALTH